ncbi:hypothetical protein PENTCL1PPCAC_890, partial [Pristionchus entomophagus]
SHIFQDVTISEKEGESEVVNNTEETTNASEEEGEPFYDKTSSFFDRISCEALEKAEGKKTRPDWRKERETNQEVFGHQAVRSLNYRRRFRTWHAWKSSKWRPLQQWLQQLQQWRLQSWIWWRKQRWIQTKQSKPASSSL